MQGGEDNTDSVILSYEKLGGGEKMRKKIMLFSIMLLALLIVSAIPVYAVPTKGNKVAVTLNMTRDPSLDEEISVVITGPITHRHVIQYYYATITFDDGTILAGDDPEITNLVVEREVVFVPQKEGEKRIFTDYYEFTFGDGGFEGQGTVILDGFVLNDPPPGATWISSKAYGLFQGTGAFEGQTLNVGHTWGAPGSSVADWTGYWLKCQVYP